jgi:hypothetical protein
VGSKIQKCRNLSLKLGLKKCMKNGRGGGGGDADAERRRQMQKIKKIKNG